MLAVGNTLFFHFSIHRSFRLQSNLLLVKAAFIYYKIIIHNLSNITPQFTHTSATHEIICVTLNITNITRELHSKHTYHVGVELKTVRWVFFTEVIEPTTWRLQLRSFEDPCSGLRCIWISVYDSRVNVAICLQFIFILFINYLKNIQGLLVAHAMYYI